MSEPLRIGLRLLGLVLLLAGIGVVVLLFKPGPTEVADWMGESCAHTKGGESEQCNLLDVLEIAAAAPWMILIGFVLAVALRPEDRGAATIDLRFLRRGR